MSSTPESPKSAIQWLSGANGSEQISAIERVAGVASGLRSRGLKSGRDFTSVLLLEGPGSHKIVLRMDPSLSAEPDPGLFSDVGSEIKAKTGETINIESTRVPNAANLDATETPHYKRVAVMNFNSQSHD